MAKGMHAYLKARKGGNQPKRPTAQPAPADPLQWVTDLFGADIEARERAAYVERVRALAAGWLK